jgi:hypothetical protein
MTSDENGSDDRSPLVLPLKFVDRSQSVPAMMEMRLPGPTRNVVSLGCEKRINAVKIKTELLKWARL